MATMTAPKKGRKRGPKPKPEGPRKTVSFKASAEFGEWLDEFTAEERMALSSLIERALVHYAKHVGFEPEPPER
jgi:hypothetical protein